MFTIAAIACSGTSAAARVTVNDAAATRAYLKGKIALERAMAAAEPTEVNAIGALATQAKGECPGVLAGAPPHVKGEKTNQSELEVDGELLSAVFGAAEHVGHAADVRFARVVHRLHWSNPKLTRLLRSLASEQAEQSAIPLPNLCSDMKFWVASGYTMVSADTKEYLHRLQVVSSITLIESEPNEPISYILHPEALLAHRLKPYENHADRLLARKALPPEPKLTNPAALKALGPIFNAVGAVLVALGRSAPPAA
ncbi:MAG TPA: hypothetical protein VL972_00370 [Solirubrobacteraceae bacterium]|nr:hypothetical protein [Solirubrobacteraceae bacterium]